MRGSDFYYFYDQNLVICSICLQTCFANFWEGKIVENKKTRFSHAKQIFFTFFRNTNKYEYKQMLPNVFNLLEKIFKMFSV